MSIYSSYSVEELDQMIVDKQQELRDAIQAEDPSLVQETQVDINDINAEIARRANNSH